MAGGGEGHHAQVEPGRSPPAPEAEEVEGGVLGEEDVDTDEYDRDILAHEWAHYFEDRVARTDSIAGGHSPADLLDLRVAFSEGWGNSFAAMATASSENFTR